MIEKIVGSASVNVSFENCDRLPHTMADADNHRHVSEHPLPDEYEKRYFVRNSSRGRVLTMRRLLVLD